MPKYLKIQELLRHSAGRFCMVTFLKKDGSLRTMCVQPAAGKYHVKGDAASEPAKRATATRQERYPNLLPVWDVDRQAFRHINMDTVTRVAACGEEYTWTL